VVRDDLEVTGGTVPGEDAAAQTVGEVLAESVDLSPPERSAALRDLGVRFVVVDLDTVGAEAPQLSGTTLHEGRLLRVIDLGSAPDRAAIQDPVIIPRGLALWDLTAAAWFVFACLLNSSLVRERVIRFRRR
jgi:hypothetical protein